MRICISFFSNALKESGRVVLPHFLLLYFLIALTGWTPKYEMQIKKNSLTFASTVTRLILVVQKLNTFNCTPKVQFPNNISTRMQQSKKMHTLSLLMLSSYRELTERRPLNKISRATVHKKQQRHFSRRQSHQGASEKARVLDESCPDFATARDRG